MTSVARNTTTVRISRRAHAMLRGIAGQTGEQVTEVLERAVESEARRVFMERFNASYARLKADPAARAAYETEQLALEGTLADGLVDEDWRELLSAQPEEVEFVAPGDDAPAR